jgi:hypothetical protein
MKSIILLLLSLISITAFPQDKKKTDQIFLNNGSILEVHISKVSENSIDYTYPNESVQNSEKTSNIRTVVFASGRVQQFNPITSDNVADNNKRAGTTQVETRPIEANTIAILPVAFYDNASGAMWEDKSKLAQSRIYDFFEDEPSKIAPLRLQDTRNTNSWLRKANINYAQLDETPVEDIQGIVGCDYLILSKVTCDVKSNQTVNESTYAGKEKKGNKEVQAAHTSASVNENKIYNYVVVLEIYNNGKKIYNESRKPFLNTEDSWKDAYEYMLKRTPIYKRK